MNANADAMDTDMTDADADVTDADMNATDADTNATDADATDAGTESTDDTDATDADEMDATTDSHLMDADAIDAADTIDMMDADAMDATMDAHTTDTDSTDSDMTDDDAMDDDEIDTNATANTVVITRFPFGRPGTPIVGPHETSAPNESSSTATGDPVWSPFRSQLDWEVARWAKTCGVTASAITELLAIPGVGAPLLLLVSALMDGSRSSMGLDSHTERRNN